jgi:LysM repeat protein
MHAWIKLACVVLAWTILPVGVASAGRDRPVHPVQVSTRTSSISFTSAHPATRPATAALTSFTMAPATKAPATRSYVVQPGDTLSAIATRFGVRGGWPTLYAANRSVIGPDPDALNAGLTLHVPSAAIPARYTVTAGDTLSAIAARFGVRGGWPALYAANRSAIGSDPDALHAGTRLTIPSPATTPGRGPAPSGSTPGKPAPSGTAPSRPQPPAQPTTPPVHPSPSHPQPHASSSVPSWLKTVLLAVGLLAVIVFAAEPLLLARRRRRRRGVAPSPPPHKASQAHVGPAAPIGPGAPIRPAIPASPAPMASPAHQSSPHEDPTPEIPVMPVPAHEGRMKPARIVMADHDRLVITRSKQDDTICVLRPPGGDPADILRVARLVLPEGHYGKLAEQLGLPANWPMNQ